MNLHDDDDDDYEGFNDYEHAYDVEVSFNYFLFRLFLKLL